MRHPILLFFLSFTSVAFAQSGPSNLPTSLRQLSRVNIAQASMMTQGIKAEPGDTAKTEAEQPTELPAWAQTYTLLEDTTKKGTNDPCCTGCVSGDIKVNVMFDNRQSFFLGQWQRMNGLRVGFELFHEMRFGLAFYNQRGRTDITELIDDASGRDRSLQYNYVTGYLEYVLYDDWRYELSVPWNFGVGNGRVDTLTFSESENTDIWVEERNDVAMVTSIGLNGDMKVIPWLGVGAAVGYRQLIGERAVRRVFSAPFYALKVKLYVGELFKSLFNKEKMQAERQAYRDAKKANRAKE